MVFEFRESGKATLMEAFAAFIGSSIRGGVIKIPAKIGAGYVRGVKLGSSLKLMLHQYKLKEDWLFRRIAAKDTRYNVTITFYTGLTGYTANNKRLPSVRITSANIDYENLIPADTAINTIIIVVHVDDLCNMLSLDLGSSLLKEILLDEKPYFYEEELSSQMQNVADEIFNINAPRQLVCFFYKIKVQQLIYLFFTELLKRKELNHYPINESDIRMVYLVRNQMMADLSEVPSMPALARLACMSESKLKRLFKQVFGDTLYNYYQIRRMKHAAQLIKNDRLSVSDAAYTVGFSNLSHFSRLFERYIGTKPKKYSAMKHT